MVIDIISRETALESRKMRTFLKSRLLERSEELPAPGPLYHYTDSNGLLGIMRSRRLWATHSQYLNDASEFLYASSVMKQVAAEAGRGIRCPIALEPGWAQYPGG